MKDILGYEGLYAVTKKGEVFSYTSNRFLNLSINSEGYVTVGLCKDGERKTKKVHRLVGEAFLLNPEEKPIINHLDGTKTNNNICNLEWATAVENIRHSFDILGRKTNGVKGKEHYKHIGKWKTPQGIFDSSREAAKANGFSNNKSVIHRCRSTSLKYKEWEVIKHE